MTLIKTVSKYGLRGAHINLPKGWIGKKVKVIPLSYDLSYDNDTQTPTNPKVSYDKQPNKSDCHMTNELDEDEQDFINKYKLSPDNNKAALIQAALGQFKRKRLDELLSIINQN